jgi:hypothetical protein
MVYLQHILLIDFKRCKFIEAEITGDAFAFNPALGNVNDANLF